MAYWGSVAKRAAAQAAKDVKLDSLVGAVIGLISQVVIGALIFVGLGEFTDASLVIRVATAATPFLMYPLAFAIRMATAPPLLASEARGEVARIVAASEQSEAALRATVDDLEAQLHTFKNPPPPARDPDGVYQHNRLVGRVVASVVDLGRSEARFERINATGDFDPDRELEYRDLVLRILHSGPSGRANVAGTVSQSFVNVQCEVVRTL